MLQEYFPKKVEINLPRKFAIVTMNSPRDLNEFLKKCGEFYQYNYPRFFVQPYIDVTQGMRVPIQQSGFNQFCQNMPMPQMNSMMEQFGNMRLSKKINILKKIDKKNQNSLIILSLNSFNI